MKTGIIGLGNMGSSLAAGLLNGGALVPGQLYLSNRSAEKLKAFSERFPGVHILNDNRELADVCDLTFVCTRSGEIPEVLRDISPIRKGRLLVMVNAGLDLKAIESTCQGAASKLIPSVTMEVGRGVSLLCHGSDVTAAQKAELERMLATASAVRVVPEAMLAAATELTSCGPALMAEMMRQFSIAGAHHGNIGHEEAWDMVLETMVGTALLLEKGVTVNELETKVATKGGITEQGLKVLSSEMPAMMDHLMEATMAKQASVRGEMSRRIG